MAAPCLKGCGFTGTPQNHGFCSVCVRLFPDTPLGRAKLEKFLKSLSNESKSVAVTPPLPRPLDGKCLMRCGAAGDRKKNWMCARCYRASIPLSREADIYAQFQRSWDCKRYLSLSKNEQKQALGSSSRELLNRVPVSLTFSSVHRTFNMAISRAFQVYVQRLALHSDHTFIYQTFIEPGKYLSGTFIVTGKWDIAPALLKEDLDRCLKHLPYQTFSLIWDYIPPRTKYGVCGFVDELLESGPTPNTPLATDFASRICLHAQRQLVHEDRPLSGSKRWEASEVDEVLLCPIKFQDGTPKVYFPTHRHMCDKVVITFGFKDMKYDRTEKRNDFARGWRELSYRPGLLATGFCIDTSGFRRDTVPVE